MKSWQALTDTLCAEKGLEVKVQGMVLVRVFRIFDVTRLGPCPFS
jgi:hypothetical protein